MQFQSELSDGSRGATVPVTVVLDETIPALHVQTPKRSFWVNLDAVDLLEPIGHQTGTLLLEQTHQIRIPDRATHRTLKRILHRGSFWSWIDDIENSWPLIALSLLLVAGTLLAMIFWGLPRAADSIAHKLPPEVASSLGKQGLSQMRSTYLSESELEPALRAQVSDAFDALMVANELDPKAFALHFHRSESMGANAFALPSGDLVLLDGLWEIGMEFDSILGVLAHEVAHVEHKHGLQMLLRYAGISTLFALAFGDVQSSASLLVFIPKLLLEKGYSRAFETEADATAVAYLQRAGISPMVLADALENLATQASGAYVPTLISSHPNMDDRVADIRFAAAAAAER